MSRKTAKLLKKFKSGDVELRVPSFDNTEQASLFLAVFTDFVRSFYKHSTKLTMHVQEELVNNFPEELVFWAWDEIGWVEA